MDRKLWFPVEAKLAATTIDPSLRYFRDRLRIPWAYQVTLDDPRDCVQDGIRCLPARQFFRGPGVMRKRCRVSLG